MTVPPSASAGADEPFTPRFLVPLWPAPTPRTARPRESRSSDAMAAAVTAGWRVTRFVTHTATFGRLVCSATSVAATQGSMALPGVSATPIMSHRSEEHTSELQSRLHLVCRLLLEKKKKEQKFTHSTVSAKYESS